jgi:hypothetical protein
MNIRKLTTAVFCAGALIAPLGLISTASAATTPESTVTIKSATLSNGDIVVTGTYKCPKADGPAKFIEIDANQWQEPAEEEVTGLTVVRAAARDKALECTGRSRAFQTVTIVPDRISQRRGLIFEKTDVARQVSAAMVTATMITQDDYGYGFGVFDL